MGERIEGKPAGLRADGYGGFQFELYGFAYHDLVSIDGGFDGDGLGDRYKAGKQKKQTADMGYDSLHGWGEPGAGFRIVQ
jgi:hypothetical protein